MFCGVLCCVVACVQWLDFMIQPLLLTDDNPNYAEYMSTTPPLGSVEYTIQVAQRRQDRTGHVLTVSCYVTAVLHEDFAVTSYTYSGVCYPHSFTAQSSLYSVLCVRQWSSSSSSSSSTFSFSYSPLPQQLVRGDDDVISSANTGQHFNALIDEDKRAQFRAAMQQYIQLLAAMEEAKPLATSVSGTNTRTNTSINTSASDNGNANDIGDGNGSGGGNDNDKGNGNGDGNDSGSSSDSNGKPFDEANISYLTRRKVRFDGFQEKEHKQELEQETNTGASPLQVLFASEPRQSCSFRVRVPSTSSASASTASAPVEEEEEEGGGKWRRISLEPSTTSHSHRHTDLFTTLGVLGPDTEAPLVPSQILASLPTHVEVALGETQPYPDHLQARMLDRELIAHDEEDEVSALIRKDSHLFQTVIQAMVRRCEVVMESEEFKEVAEIRAARRVQKEEDRVVLAQFQVQQAWGRVCRGILQGRLALTLSLLLIF